MPIGEVAGALLSALPSAISSGVGAVANFAAVNRTNEFNRRAWLEQAEYNSPANQVKRLRAAGLNPALAMQNGMLSSGTQTSAYQAAQPPSMDFSPVGNAVIDSLRLQNERALNQAEIRNKDANTLALNQKNQFGLHQAYIDLQNSIQDLKHKGADTKFLEKRAEFMQKEINAFDDRNAAEVYKIRQEGAKAEQEAFEVAMRAEYQSIVNQYAPEAQQKMLANLDAQHASLMAAAAQGNTAAAYNIALTALTNSQKDGVKIDNDTKKRMVMSIVNKAQNEARNMYYTAIMTKKASETGSWSTKYFGSNQDQNVRVLSGKQQGGVR